MSDIDYEDLREGDLVSVTKTMDTGSTATYEGLLVRYPVGSKHLTIDGYAFAVGSVNHPSSHSDKVVEVLKKAPDPALEAEAVELTRIIAQNYGFADIVRDIQEAGYRKVSK